MNRYLAIVLRARETVKPCEIAQESAPIGLDTTTVRCYSTRSFTTTTTNGGSDSDNDRASSHIANVRRCLLASSRRGLALHAAR